MSTVTEGTGLQTSSDSESAQTQSLHVNVVGQPRTEPVRIPAYIKSGRPGQTTNYKVNSNTAAFF